MSSAEMVFRDTLRWCVSPLTCGLPQDLSIEIWNHLYRRDTAKNSLCFDSPLRRELMIRVHAWAQCHASGIAQAVAKVYPLQHDAWPGPEHYPSTDPVPVPVPRAVVPAEKERELRRRGQARFRQLMLFSGEK